MKLKPKEIFEMASRNGFKITSVETFERAETLLWQAQLLAGLAPPRTKLEAMVRVGLERGLKLSLENRQALELLARDKFPACFGLIPHKKPEQRMAPPSGRMYHVLVPNAFPALAKKL